MTFPKRQSTAPTDPDAIRLYRVDVDGGWEQLGELDGEGRVNQLSPCSKRRGHWLAWSATSSEPLLHTARLDATGKIVGDYAFDPTMTAAQLARAGSSMLLATVTKEPAASDALLSVSWVDASGAFRESTSLAAPCRCRPRRPALGPHR